MADARVAEHRSLRISKVVRKAIGQYRSGVLSRQARPKRRRCNVGSWSGARRGR